MKTKKLKTGLDICNLALRKVGKKPIKPLDTLGVDSKQALFCTRYHQTRQRTLCSKRWDFATKTVTLKGKAVAGKQGGYRHALPADCLRFLTVDCGEWTLGWRKLITPTEVVKVTYLYDCENVTLFPDAFIDAIVDDLVSFSLYLDKP